MKHKGVASQLSREVVRWQTKAFSVSKRLYLASRDIGAVHQSNAPARIQCNVRGNHIEGIREIEKFNPLMDLIRFPDTSYTWMLLPLDAVRISA